MKNRPEDIPVFDDAGINLADHNDSLGLKTEYISRLQELALRRILGACNGTAVDLGCGYGRMYESLKSFGFSRVVGVDPSSRVLEAARRINQGGEFLVGGLPDLPQSLRGADCVFLLNVLRSLHLAKKVEIAAGAARIVGAGGRLIVLDNIRLDHPDYVDERTLVDLFSSEGLRLVSRTVIRGARLPWIYLIRYGLLPRSVFDWLARRELALMSRFNYAVRWQYKNVVWVFECR